MARLCVNLPACKKGEAFLTLHMQRNFASTASPRANFVVPRHIFEGGIDQQGCSGEQVVCAYHEQAWNNADPLDQVTTEKCSQWNTQVCSSCGCTENPGTHLRRHHFLLHGRHNGVKRACTQAADDVC